MMDLSIIKKNDPELYESMMKELVRQRGNLELIASENIVSPTVLAAAGTHLTNKYAEGLPGKRYYGGCMYVDDVENLAIKNFLVQIAQMFNHIVEHLQTFLYFSHCLSRAIQLWV